MKFIRLTTLLLTGTLFATANANTTTVYHIKSQSRFMQTAPKGVVCTPISVQDGNDCKIMSMRSDGRTADSGRMASLPEQAVPNVPSVDPNAENEQLKKERDALIAREKEERCKTMRTNLAAFSTGGRIYETNANGERVYLNDQEISSKRQRTIDAIEKDCK